MDMHLQDKTALITGGARGIGESIAPIWSGRAFGW